MIIITNNYCETIILNPSTIINQLLELLKLFSNHGLRIIIWSLAKISLRLVLRQYGDDEKMRKIMAIDRRGKTAEI